MLKVILDEKNRNLSDSVIFIKNLLYLIFKEPKIIATLVRNYDDAASLKALEETLCTTYYEDIIADEVYDDDLIRLLAELLEMEFEKERLSGVPSPISWQFLWEANDLQFQTSSHTSSSEIRHLGIQLQE